MPLEFDKAGFDSGDCVLVFILTRTFMSDWEKSLLIW